MSVCMSEVVERVIIGIYNLEIYVCMYIRRSGWQGDVWDLDLRTSMSVCMSGYLQMVGVGDIWMYIFGSLCPYVCQEKWLGGCLGFRF